MHVIVPPVVVRDRIVRIVSPISSLLEVEEWMGEWWEPCTVTFRTVSGAPRAGDELLAARGVPREDWGSSVERISSEEIEAMLLAHVIFRPTLPVPMTDEPAGRRRKVFVGSARFRGGRQAKGSRASDRGAPPPTWKGPWRRASDRLTPLELPGDESPDIDHRGSV